MRILAIGFLTFCIPLCGYATEKKTYVGGTLGGQQLAYDFQVSQQVNEKLSFIGAISYLPVYQGQTDIGIQVDISPFENWFALSPGMSAWILADRYTIYVPDFGLAGKIRMGKKWEFKIRPAVFYQTRKVFIFPWLGLTISKQI